jgi:hypothetical protein
VNWLFVTSLARSAGSHVAPWSVERDDDVGSVPPSCAQATSRTDQGTAAGVDGEPRAG